MEYPDLPVITENINHHKSLSMDDYLKFVMFNLKHNFDKESYHERKKNSAVNVPFVLK